MKQSVLQHLLVMCTILVFAAVSSRADEPATKDVPNLLSLSQGVIPVAISETGEQLRVGFEQAVKAIDGSHTPFILNRRPGDSATRLEIIYELPALTTFSGFKIPNVWETPSPSQTFFGTVVIYGADRYVPDRAEESNFGRLADVQLQAHVKPGQFTEMNMVNSWPVKWIKLILYGGLDIQSSKTFFEFSELIGNGEQQPVQLADNFTGRWKGRGVKMELMQDQAAVSGCYDLSGELSGTVSGNVLRATGQTTDSGVHSLFVLMVDGEGVLRGMRSTNGAPFRLLEGSPDSTLKTRCTDFEPATLACGAVLHGIQFAYDSSRITPDSYTLIDQLQNGLNKLPAEQAIRVEGHTSSEGSQAYNDDLSLRRAQSVIQALVVRGIDENRLQAAGIGERRPIASNDDEAGRSLNRRVEIHCDGTE